MGKTALLLLWALKQLLAGIKVFFFTLEMPKADMIARMVSLQSGIRLLDILERKLDENEVRKIVGAPTGNSGASWRLRNRSTAADD